MARYYIPMPITQPATSYNGDVERRRDDIFEFRERIRRTLDPDGLHTNWLVGDLALWPGTSGFEGYGFGIYHMSSSSPTGPGWFFAFPGTFSTADLLSTDQILQSARLSEYFRSNTGATTFNQDGVPALHYHHTAGTVTPYAFGYDANGLLAGGDFSAPSVDPFTNLDGFMPELGAIYGIVPNLFGQDLKWRWSLVFDDQIPFCSFYAREPDSSETYLWLSGQTLEPAYPSDTNPNGSTFLSMDPLGVLSQERTFAYDGTATRQEFSIDTPALPTTTDPTSFIRPILSIPSYLKGFFDVDIVRNIGPFQQGLQTLFVDAADSSVVFFNRSANLALPFTTAPPFPAETPFFLQSTFYRKLLAEGRASTLVAYYGLDERTGTSIRDEGPNRYRATAVGSPTLGASTAVAGGDTAIAFNGTSQYLDMGANSRWDYIHQTGEFTVSLWANLSNDGTSRGLLGNTTGPDQYGFSIEADFAGGQVVFRLHADPDEYQITTAVPADGWHNFILTGQGSTLTAYLDGVDVGSVSISPDTGGNTSSASLSVGAIGQSVSFFNSGIDAVSFFSRGFNPSEVTSLYNTGV